MRRLAALLPAALAGCVSDPETAGLSAKTVEQQKVSAGTLHLGQKVDQIGSELVAQSPFLGVNPTFAVVGRPGVELSHPDLNGVFVSEGLAARCSDDELAAVLALELGRMSVEARQARALARRDPLRPAPSGGAAAPGGAVDPNQLMAQALVDKQAAGAGRGPAGESARDVAARVLRDSGRSEALLAAAEPLHAEATRAAAGPGRVGEQSRPPRWTN